MMYRKTSRVVPLALALCTFVLVGLSPVRATVPVLPYLDQRTICGTWEAIELAEPRIFVAVIDGAKTGSIAMVTGSRTRPDSETFHVSQVRVDKAGFVTLEAVADDGARLVIRGRGRRAANEGSLEADVELWGDTDEYGPTVFHVKFHMREQGYFATLRALMQKADAALSAAGRKK